MSLFGGTDCSVNGNAIAQLNKHTQEDRSLQRQTHGVSAVNNQSFKTDTLMNQRDLEQFMAGGGQSPSAFQFQPMRHELNVINRTGSKPQNWLQDFHSQTQSPIHRPAQIATQQGGSHQWASEFRSASPQQSQIQPQFQQHQQSRIPMSMMGGGYRPMMGMSMGTKNISQSLQKEDMSVDWDNRFREIEELSDIAQDREDGSKQTGGLVDDIVVDDKYQANFQEVWDLLNLDLIENDFITQQYEDFKKSQDQTYPADMPQWEKDFARYASTRANFGDYKFEEKEQNQFIDLPREHDPYEIGLQLMENGAKLSEAALAFEAAIHKDANRVEAWLKLGEVQTQNEKEIAGISALEKCLDLHPENSEALMTLAISYINEGYDNAAFATLERWISTKYPQVADKARQQNLEIIDEDRYTLNKRVTNLFMSAAQLSPDQASMDADVQMGLGVLFYAQEDFDKTIDCFKAALSIRPNDPLLWNRLGASLANLNRSEEAVDAYFKALELKPTFVRARYNLGVSCINIGCYKEAAEHLLSGLAMHEVEGQETTLNQNQSSSLMETLKRAFIALDRRDLVEIVRPGMDLNQFRGEFNF